MNLAKKCINLIFFDGSGGIGQSYWNQPEPRRNLYSFRTLYYAAKVTNETRFLVNSLNKSQFI